MMNNVNENIEILLVEDNPTDAELTLRAFKKHNLTNKIHWVKDGEEALNFVFCRGEYAERRLTNLPHLILLDLHLPKVDGLSVLRAIKSDESTKTTPVVILTSSREERDMVESYALGANSYISKPVEFEAFMDAVAELGMYWMLLNQTVKTKL
ncbi:MAG: two-component system response regulator [Gallionellales bacterium RIFOXYD12_FULL_53_10]|nr:MAG: two-component system response regulator [Gallionellales bacterium GWA2_54_124]OGT20491.1 MAG: two-component system response regulator [Gallionellales bacterium RIFOXYD12_FULL_53_10]